MLDHKRLYRKTSDILRKKFAPRGRTIVPHKRVNDELVKRIKAGDIEAETLLIENNRGLIMQITKRYIKHDEYEVFFSEAALALIKAAHDFDPSRGYLFSTVAWKYVQSAVVHQMRTSRRKIPFDLASFGQSGLDARHPCEKLMITEECDLLEVYLKLLPVRWKEILMARYKGETLKSIGRRYSLTKERVRQIELQALVRMKELMTDP